MEYAINEMTYSSSMVSGLKLGEDPKNFDAFKKLKALAISAEAFRKKIDLSSASKETPCFEKNTAEPLKMRPPEEKYFPIALRSNIF